MYSYVYESLADLMDQGMCKCANTADVLCMIGLEKYKIYMKLKSYCLEVSNSTDNTENFELQRFL